MRWRWRVHTSRTKECDNETILGWRGCRRSKDRQYPALYRMEHRRECRISSYSSRLSPLWRVSDYGMAWISYILRRMRGKIGASFWQKWGRGYHEKWYHYRCYNPSVFGPGWWRRDDHFDSLPCTSFFAFNNVIRHIHSQSQGTYHFTPKPKPS